MKTFPFWVNSIDGITSPLRRTSSTLRSDRTPSSPSLYLHDIFACGLHNDDSGKDEIWDHVLLCNYMIDLEWLFHEAPDLLRVREKLIILSGEQGSATHIHTPTTSGSSSSPYTAKSKALQNVNPFLHAARQTGFPTEKLVVLEPPLPLAFGTHHTKMCLLLNKRGMRVGIFTGNFVYADWHCKTQAAYVQDFPWRTIADSSSSAGTSPATTTYLQNVGPFPTSMAEDFRLQLERYLRHCGVYPTPPQSPGQAHVLGQWNTAFLDAVDFSAARVRIVCSVPGSHEGAAVQHFGLGRLAAVQAHHRIGAVETTPACLSWQYSSQGSLDESFLGSLERAMLGCLPIQPGAGVPQDVLAGVTVRVVYPTEGEVRQSVEGWRGGFSLPLHMNNCHPFINARLYRWGSRAETETTSVVDVDAVTHEDGSEAAVQGYRHVMPHLKTYAEVCSSGAGVHWLLLTSANLSKAAWGKLTAPVRQKGNLKLTIRSYEMGVLYLPASADSCEAKAFTCTPSTADAGVLCRPASLSNSSSTLFPVPVVGRGANSAVAGHLYLPYNIRHPEPYASTAVLLAQERESCETQERVPQQDIPWVLDAPHLGVDAFGMRIGEAVQDTSFYGKANWISPSIRKRQRSS